MRPSIVTLAGKVLGLGTDIYKVGRFRAILERDGLDGTKIGRLCDRVLNSSHELPEFEKLRSAKDLDGCERLLAGSWSLKEAIYKSLDDEDQKLFAMNRWWKLNGDRGRPVIGGDYLAEKRSEEFKCSVSHDGEYMISTVIRQNK